MNLLSFQLPDLEDFQSCKLAYQLDIDRHEKLFIQIMNRSPNDGGLHWLTISNINCMENTIKGHDSAYSDLPHEEELTIASLVAVTADKPQFIFPNVALQTNGYDCGLYAVANATALAYGGDPNNTGVYPKAVENHLYNVWKTGTSNLSQVKRKRQRNVFDVPLFCLCRMPDTRTLYIYCDACG